jgi:hypothetical protein
MRKRLIPAFIVLLAAALAMPAASDMRLTVQDLMAFIRSSINLKQPDRQVAEYLKHVRLSNKLDDRTIEELQGMGAGPKTVAALRDLRDSSATLATPPPVVEKAKPAPLAGPDSIEQGKIISTVREYAMNYTKQLPNYLCIQVTRRSVAPTGSESWRLQDTITTRLSFNDGHEDYKVVLVNSQPVTDMPMEKLGGTVSQGEFASMMLDIFRQESQARFEWDHWATLRGKRCYVFSYDIEQVNSRYHIIADRTQDYVPAYRGLIYIDADTNFVTRIVMTPHDIPAGFPIQNVKTVLDYDYTKIGDNEYLLPMKSVVSSSGGRYLTKNENEFRLYRKFGTESTIKFETPDPLPDEKTKEKPPKP